MDRLPDASGLDGGSLRAARVASGLTLSQAARQLGYSVAHLSNVERGVRQASAELLRAYGGLSDNESCHTGSWTGGGETPAEPVVAATTADARDDFGLRLMRMRLARGWSLTMLAQRTGVSRSYLGNLERGRRDAPSIEVARSCDTALAAGGALVARAEAHASARPSPIPVDLTPDIDPAQIRVAWSDGPQEALADGHARLATLRSLAQHLPAHRVLPELASRARIYAASAGAAGDGGHGRGLWLLAARYAEFAGWMAHEDGAEADASRWTLAAARWAERGGDGEMAGYRWERNALTTLYRADGPETVALAQRAAAQRGVSTRVPALALRREAQGHALAGDATRFRRTLDAAERLAADAPTPYPHGDSWGPNSIEDSSRVVEASGLVDLGLHRAAVRLFGPDPGSAIPAPAARTRVRFAVRGALAHAGAGAVEHACSLMARELPLLERLESATIRTDLERFAAVLNRHRAVPEVLALLPDLHQVLRTTRGLAR